MGHFKAGLTIIAHILAMSGKPLFPADAADQLAKEAEKAAGTLFVRFGRDAIHVAMQNRQRARMTGRLTEACAWRTIQKSITELIEREADRAYRDRLPARTAVSELARRLVPSGEHPGKP